MRRMPRRGSALVLALGTLALMSAFAVGLLAIVRIESAASGNALDGRRATLAAEAGLNRSVVELSGTFQNPLTSQVAPWAYLDKQGDFGHGIPIPQAGRISLWSPDASPARVLVLDDGTPLPYSGSLGQPYDDKGGCVYTLKIIDVTTQIDLNDERPGLAKMLDTLGLAIADQRGADPVRGRGAQIVALRDSQVRLASKRELTAILSSEDYALLADFVTVDGWADPAARRPLLPGERDPKTEDMTLPRFTLERRCPINVNGAPKAVLVALLAGVGTSATEPVTFDQARKIADLMIQRRKSTDPMEGAFRGVVDLEEWITSLSGGGSQAVLSTEQAGALIANLDPNLRVVEVNPDTTARLPVTKYDLDYRTTEATFFSHGMFEVTSLGRVVAAGKLVAETFRLGLVRAYEVARQTTQLDFEMAALTATTDNVASFPNQTRRLGGWAASPDDGYVQLDDPEAQVGTLDTGIRAFQAPYTKALDANEATAQTTYLGAAIPGFYDLRSGLPTQWLDPFSYKTVSAPAASMTSSTYAAFGQRLQDKLYLSGGDLAVDGTHTSVRHRNLWYADSPPLDEGTLDLWLKIDQDPTATTGSVVQAVNFVSSDVCVVTDLTASSDGTTLTLELRRKVYYQYLTSFVPWSVGETRTRSVLPQLGRYGEWHHVRIAWVSGVEASLYVDGDLAPPSAKLSRDASVVQWPPGCSLPPTDQLVVGGHDSADGPLYRCMTVDVVVVEGPPVALPASFPGPERYPAESPDFVGRFVGGFGPFDQNLEFGTLFWTERDPKSWGPVKFSPGDFTTTGVVQDVGTLVEIGPGHAGKPGPAPAPPGPPGPGGPPAPGPGGPPPGSGGATGGPPAPPPVPGAVSVPTTSGDYLRPELQMLRGTPSPGDRGIVYEILFKYQKENLVTRGIVVPPLDVSPILDDVTLVYRRRAMIVRVETDD